jgi:hypothetical protein
MDPRAGLDVVKIIMIIKQLINYYEYIKAVTGTHNPSRGNQCVTGYRTDIPELSFHELFIKADVWKGNAFMHFLPFRSPHISLSKVVSFKPLKFHKWTTRSFIYN